MLDIRNYLKISWYCVRVLWFIL